MESVISYKDTQKSTYCHRIDKIAKASEARYNAVTLN